MTPDVYVPLTGQFGSNVGSSLWFTIPKDLQNGADNIIDRASQDKDLDVRVRNRCDDILASGEEVRYSEGLYIRVGSRRYNLYRANGTYRIGAYGESCSAPYETDQEHILNYLRNNG